MRQKHLGENERTIIKILSENNNEISRSNLINWTRIELGKSFETISWLNRPGFTGVCFM